ncbi:MAG TPA: hypothetical protein DCM05_08970 [Elusimicrobia bacterium]|nr:hypothetical protein [Elusimicrobiota bacterium]
MRRSALCWASLLAALPAHAQFPPDAAIPDTGRLSILLIIYMSIVFFWAVVALFVYIGLFKAYHRLRRKYRERRKAVFRLGVELTLMEEPYEKIVEAFRPRRLGDLDISKEVLVDSIRHLTGDPQRALLRVAGDLGFVEHTLRRLKAGSRHTRGRAMEDLGLLHCSQAIVAILSIMDQESLDLKIVALRSLAAIGDPAALPYFLRAADTLPPTLIPRLASLMLEFGPKSHPYVQQLINQHGDEFPSLLFEELLKELAAGMKAPA